MKIGIIQPRGLGDLLIALPIAKHYVDEGHKVYWPICEEFWPSVRETAPWVQWIPMVTDARGEFFYDEPMKRLKNFKCDEIICLYQALNSQKQLSQVPYFQIQKFDEFKYTKTGVPFLKKWTLGECITRNKDREQKLYDKLVSNENYAVIHTEGSDFTCSPDLSSIPDDWQQIKITPVTECVFDWLKILEGAQAGLSWITVLRKREHFRIAFDDFNAARIARYDAAKIESLLHNPGIIRNRLKIQAAVINAQKFLTVQEEFGSFDSFIWKFVNSKPKLNAWRSITEVPASTPESDAMSRELKQRGFKFVGTTICYAYMQATGMVNDHTTDCFRHNLQN